MNGLFGVVQNMNPVPQQPMHPDVAAAIGDQPNPVTPPPAPQADHPKAMSADQQALNDWLAQQEQAKQQQQAQPAPKYSVGDPYLDKYINMFIGQ